MEYTATATPQQNGVSERDGRSLATMTRYLLKDGNFPHAMWGMQFLQQSTCGTGRHIRHWEEKKPFLKMHGKDAALSGLRAIGPRELVHTDTYTTKLGK